MTENERTDKQKREHAWDSMFELLDVPEDELIEMIEYYSKGLAIAKAVLLARSRSSKKHYRLESLWNALESDDHPHRPIPCVKEYLIQAHFTQCVASSVSGIVACTGLSEADAQSFIVSHAALLDRAPDGEYWLAPTEEGAALEVPGVDEPDAAIEDESAESSDTDAKPDWPELSASQRLLMDYLESHDGNDTVAYMGTVLDLTDAEIAEAAGHPAFVTTDSGIELTDKQKPEAK